MTLFGAERPAAPIGRWIQPPNWLIPRPSEESRWRVFLKGVTQPAYIFVGRSLYSGTDRIRWLWRYRRAAALVLLVMTVSLLCSLSGIVAYRMWRVPDWVVQGALPGADTSARISTYRAAQAAVLGIVVQAAGGLALIAGLFFTWRLRLRKPRSQNDSRAALSNSPMSALKFELVEFRDWNALLWSDLRSICPY
jgi:hypothetical protein